MQCRVLVADDDPDILSVVSSSVRQSRAQVVSVSSGVELLERLADEGPFDLVITDVTMPRITGIEAVRSLRKAGSNVPVILMTGDHSATVFEAIRALEGRTTLLPKPFSTQELQTAIALLFSRDPEIFTQLSVEAEPSAGVADL